MVNRNKTTKTKGIIAELKLKALYSFNNTEKKLKLLNSIISRIEQEIKES